MELDSLAPSQFGRPVIIDFFVNLNLKFCGTQKIGVFL
jgi:hypothetical protein